ncbi:Conserved_hypothetical protein [Hexamita inflata]|uniref:Uncharacterized protein n=1 Tax=Hexamita inflata TaxID=28002 RepID=A0AA86P3T9_9EUKA|nr:Conserved hypothetical protein [Hexamita inflata]
MTLQPLGTTELQIHERIPLFRRTEAVFEKELRDCESQQMVDLGTNKDCAYECQEKHIKNAVYNNKQIPTKPIEKEPYDIKGHVPNGPYTVHSISLLVSQYQLQQHQYWILNELVQLTQIQSLLLLDP